MGGDAIVVVIVKAELAFADKKQASAAAKSMVKALPSLRPTVDGATVRLDASLSLTLEAWASLVLSAYDVAERALSGQIEIRIDALSDVRRLHAGGRVERPVVERPEGAVARLGTLALRSAGHVSAGITTLTPRNFPAAYLGTAAAFSPDGRRIAVGSSGTGSTRELDSMLAAAGDLRVWDAETGELLGIYLGIGYSHRVQAVAFSPDGERVACGTWGHRGGNNYGEVFLIDLRGGRVLASKRVHKREVYCVAFSPTGEVFASVGADREPLLWDARTGEIKARLVGHTMEPSSVVFLPGGRELVTTSTDGTLRRWDASSGQSVGWVDAGKALAAALLPDGRTLACIEDRRLILRDVVTGQIVPKGSAFESHNVESVSAGGTAERSTVAVGRYPDREDGELWDAGSGELVGRLPGIAWPVLSPDGRRAAGACGKAIELAGVDRDTLLFQAEGHSEGVNRVAISPRGDRVVSLSLSKMFLLWDTSRPEAPAARLQQPFGGMQFVERLAFSPEGERLAVVSSAGLELRGLDGRLLASCDLGGVDALFTPDGSSLVVASRAEGQVLVLDGRTLSPQRRFAVDGAARLSLSPDGWRVAVSGGSKVTIAEVETGNVLWSLDSGYHEAKASFSADGSTLHVIDHAHRLVAIELASGGRGVPRPLPSPERPLRDMLGFSPDGALVAGDAMGTLLVWELESGREVLVGGGHARPINEVAFSAGSRRAVSASGDTTLLVWEVR